MVTLALRVPLAVGVNVTLMVQLALIASELEQLSVSLKSLVLAPVTAILLILSASVPLFVSVTVCAGLVVPTFWLLKLKLVALRLSPGVGTTPVPPRKTL